MRAGRHRDRRRRRSTFPRCCATARRERAAASRPHVRSTTSRRRSGAGTTTPSVVVGPAPGRLPHRAARQTEVPVSILIPFRDEPRLLRTCVDSIAATTGMHTSVELVLIDNGSSDPETLTLVERLADRPDVRVLTDPGPFNWAALNNAGASVARGERPLVPQQRHRGAPERLVVRPVRPGAPARRRGRGGPPPLPGPPPAALRPGRRAHGGGRTRPRRPARGGARLPAHGDRGARVLSGDRRLPGHTARGLRAPGRLRRVARGRPERCRLLPAGCHVGLADDVRARGRTDPPRVAEPRHGGWRGRRRPLRRSMEGLHFRGRPLLEPPPHPGGSVVRIGSPGGGGRLEHDGTRPSRCSSRRVRACPTHAAPARRRTSAARARRHQRRSGVAPSCRLGPARRHPPVAPRLGRTSIRPIGSPPPAGAGRRHRGHRGALRSPGRPPDGTGSRDRRSGRCLRPGDRASCGRRSRTCNALWHRDGTRSRESTGGGRRRLPLARPSERTGLRGPVHRRSGQSLRTGGRPRARGPRVARSRWGVRSRRTWACPVRCTGRAQCRPTQPSSWTN